MLGSWVRSGKKRQRRQVDEGGSAFVPCPLCAREFSKYRIAQHAAECDGGSATKEKNKGNAMKKSSGENKDLEKRKVDFCGQGEKRDAKVAKKKKRWSEILKSELKSQPVKGMAGLFLFHDFITEEEERALVHAVENASPAFKESRWNGLHLGKEWGAKIKYQGSQKTGYMAPDGECRSVPAFIKPFIERMGNGSFLPTSNFVPNQCNAIKYIPSENHVLGAHFDERRLSGEMIANLSLLCDATMVYHHPASDRRLEVKLPRRSLQVITGEARYQWTHAIPTENIHGDQRISLTFRRQGIP